MQWGLFMFRNSQGQISGTRVVSVFSSQDLPSVRIIQTYSYTGVDQDIFVPSGVSFCEYIIWAAAGSRGQDNVSHFATYRGGAGGATTGILAVTGGETLIAIVGQGGLSANPSFTTRAGGYGGSGSCAMPAGNYIAGRGGGRSAIRRSSTELATAGGGGGGGVQPSSLGGLGGGATGGSTAAGGGTQSAGGAASSTGTAGSAFQGGNGGSYGGSGGGGFFGGGGGGNADNNGGGGGSGFAGGTSALTYQGTGATPPLNTDPRYPGGGVGASNTTDNQAGHGFIYLGFF